MIAKKCLNDQEDDRPSATELCDSLSKLKLTLEYRRDNQPLSDPKVVPNREQAASEIQNPKLADINDDNKESHTHHQTREAKTEPMWTEGNAVPKREMVRGDVAMKDENKAYFMNKDGEMWLYDSTDGSWSKHQKCPYEYSSLAVVDGFLTAIGGLDSQLLTNHITNTLLSLTGDGEIKKWEKKFPQMVTPRYLAAAVTTTQHLIVSGGVAAVQWRFGIKRNENQRTVEVMSIDAKAWSKVANMPRAYSKMSATICKDKLYLLGGVDRKTKTLRVVSCSLTELIRSSETSVGVWNELNDAPIYYSTCTTFNDELLVVGGQYQDQRRSVNEVYKYNPEDGTWKKITNCLTPRQYGLVATFNSKNMMVVMGGYQDGKLCNCTDIMSL